MKLVKWENFLDILSAEEILRRANKRGCIYCGHHRYTVLEYLNNQGPKTVVKLMCLNCGNSPTAGGVVK